MSEENNANFNFPLPQTMSEFIYEHLKKSILSNELTANQRINEVNLSKYFKVSRTPVREAILRLEAKGFVKIDSHRRVLVKEVSYKELIEIFQVLGALDRLAITLAVDNLKSKQIDKLERLSQKMEKSCKIETIEKYFEYNEAFHDEIWKAVPNNLLHEILCSVRDKMQRYTYARIYAFKKPGALKRSLMQHKELVEAIRKKDKENLKDMIVQHRVCLLEVAPFTEGLKEFLTSEEKKKNIK
jgi:DNA-binding GntR family transcriptional regulator